MLLLLFTLHGNCISTIICYRQLLEERKVIEHEAVQTLTFQKPNNQPM